MHICVAIGVHTKDLQANHSHIHVAYSRCVVLLPVCEDLQKECEEWEWSE